MGEHCCGHDGLIVHARQDPTQTTTLRKAFVSAMNKRFRALRGKIRREVLEADGFGLKANRGDFEFRRDADKVAAFREWLQGEIDGNVLERRPGMPRAENARRMWASEYIREAYQRGVQHSASEMAAAGAAVADRWVEAAGQREIHTDRLGLLYTRAFDELDGITQAMDQQISRTLAEGLAKGKSATDIAGAINDRVDKVGRHRAAMLARTETINAHAEASLMSYEEAGVEGVRVRAEFSTAGDDRVCDVCAALEGRTYRPEDAHGIIPVHPNCRCAFIPAIDDARGVELR